MMGWLKDPEQFARRFVPKTYHRHLFQWASKATGVGQKIWSVVPGNSTRFGPPRGLSFVEEDMPEGSRRSMCMSTILYPSRNEVFEGWRRLGNCDHHWQFTQAANRAIRAGGFYRFRNARVYGAIGSIIDSEDRLVSPLSFELARRHGEQSIFTKFKLPAVRNMPGRLAVVTRSTMHNFYHWMVQVLPRLHLLEEAGDTIDKYYIPVGRRFQLETLQLLNLPMSDIIEPSPQLHLRFDEVIVPSQLEDATPRWAVQFLRDKLLPRVATATATPRLRLYVSRANAPGRRLAQEESLVAELSKLGFTCVVLENFTVAEQIGLFNNAEIVVGPHGAGMTNIVFCKPGTMIVEIFPAQYIIPVYGRLAEVCDLRYFYYIGKGRLVQPGEHGVGRVDISIDTAEFLGLLQDAIEASAAPPFASGQARI